MRMVPAHQHARSARGKPLLNQPGPGQSNRHETQPALVVETRHRCLRQRRFGARQRCGRSSCLATVPWRRIVPEEGAPPAVQREASPRSRRIAADRVPANTSVRSAIPLRSMKSNSCGTEYDRSRGFSRASASASAFCASRDPRSSVTSGCCCGSDPSVATRALDLSCGGSDAEPPAILLEHVDAGPPVRRIDHHVHRAVGLQHTREARAALHRDQQDDEARPCRRSDRTGAPAR